MPLVAILIESLQCDGRPLFPHGTAVSGRVQSVRKVGMGFRHETAALELEFDLISPDDSSPITMHARVLDVDNARESVKNGGLQIDLKVEHVGLPANLDCQASFFRSTAKAKQASWRVR